MKILLLHCDYLKFKPLKKALKEIEDLSEKKTVNVKEPLVVMIAVEKYDNNSDEVVKELIKNISEIAEKINAKNIVLYPYAHLSKNLASPENAIGILKKTEEEIKKIKNFKIFKAPFGYYKEFEMKVKGHPLSELAREIRIDKEEYDYKKLLNEISKTKLDTSKLKENDHRIIGKEMDLFSFNETAPGMVFWHNDGLIIFNELINFWRKEHKKANYQEIKTPQILDKRLWQISGHWEKYKENIFLTDYENRQFAVKPMNCPGGILIYKNKPKSYRDLPLRVGELGVVHRQELSGVLGGLFRVIQFTQDDAHVFCTEKQLEQEIFAVMDLVDILYSKFGFKYTLELSTRPEKRIGSDRDWNKAEEALKKVLEKRKINYKINEGDGAFYGPKIDYHLKDSLGRTWQCGTIQIDFSMPERFELEYIDKDNQRKRPIMVHRAIYGSFERFIGILLEHYKGRLPVWLSPVQQKIIEQLKEEITDLRIDSDFKNVPISSKVKEAEIKKVPYIIVIGDKEEKENFLSVRIKGDKKIQRFKIKEFAEKIRKEIENRE